MGRLLSRDEEKDTEPYQIIFGEIEALAVPVSDMRDGAIRLGGS